MSRFHLRLTPENQKVSNQNHTQQFLRQHYVRGNFSDLISDSASSDAWQQFCQAWDGLLTDAYMGDGGHYRQRRYSVFDYSEATHCFTINPDQSHFQALNYNSLNGGVYREYPSFSEDFLNNNLFKSVLSTVTTMVTQVSGTTDWHIEAHQFRILASSEESGKPTPEGIHKDGRDYVFVVLVNRSDVKGGSSRIYNEKGKVLQQWKMRNPLEFMLVDDRRLLHYVTSVKPMHSNLIGHRDVLVITFRKSA